MPVVEWYRGATRTSGTGAVPAFPQEHDESPQHSDPLSDTPAGGRLEIQTITDAGDVLGTMMGPDPLTGLAGLPSVLVHLGGAVATLHRATVNSVAVVLVDVRNPGPGTPPIPDAAFSAVANRLKNHVRNGDIVGRIGQGTIAVIANVRTGPEDGSIIERRLVEAARNALPGAPEASVRSALTSAFGDTALGAEDLLRQAIAQLAAL
jgi:GGDEF domain-containing protein